MRIFGSCYECYVPDTQILYPLIFLHDVPTLSSPNDMYKECIDALRKSFVLKILPENEVEFHRLIFRKFQFFLADIKSEALRSRSKGLNIATFEKKVNSLIWQKSYGDFCKYWKEHKNKFGEWLDFDKSKIEDEIHKIVVKMLVRYIECTEENKHEWTAKDEEVVSLLYEVLKKERDKGNLSSKAHDEDLKMLAGCLRYVQKYLPEGVCYLVTNDTTLYNCANKVPTLKCLTGSSTKRLVGFKVIKPKDFLKKLKAHTKNTSSKDLGG